MNIDPPPKKTEDFSRVQRRTLWGLAGFKRGRCCLGLTGGASAARLSDGLAEHGIRAWRGLLATHPREGGGCSRGMIWDL